MAEATAHTAEGPEGLEISPCHLPPELWAIVFSHVPGDLYLTTRAAFLAACRAYDIAAQTLRPPEPAVFLEARAPDGTLCRGRRISAETFALYWRRLQLLGLIAWPVDVAAIGQDVTYDISNGITTIMPAQTVFDVELRALWQSARDIGAMAYTHATREVLAAWTAEHVLSCPELRDRLYALSAFARSHRNDPPSMQQGVNCDHLLGKAGCHSGCPNCQYCCPNCPPEWKAPLSHDSHCTSAVAILYAVIQKSGNDISDGLARHLAQAAISGPMLLPPWHNSCADLHEPLASVPVGAVHLDRIVRLLPTKDVRIDALSELLHRLREAGAEFADPDAPPTALQLRMEQIRAELNVHEADA